MGETARGLLERVTSALGRLSIQVSLNVSGNQSHGSVVIGGAPEVGEPASSQDFTSATSSPREPAGGQSPGPTRVGDLGLKTLNRPNPANPPLEPDDGAEPEEAVEEEPEDKDIEGIQPTSTLEQVLLSQTRILKQLAQNRSQSSDPLNMLLGQTSQDADDVPKSSAVKGIAARQLLIDSFRKRPDKVTANIRERLAAARRKATVGALEPRDMWYHFQESVPLGSHRTLTHLAFLVARMWEHCERNEIEHLKALVGLTAIFAEQAAMDNGGLRLAHLLTCADEPPFAQTELHRQSRSEFVHSQLADPRWVATQLAYLRDTEVIQEKSSKYAKGPLPKAAPADNPNPKWRPKKVKGKKEENEQES